MGSMLVFECRAHPYVVSANAHVRYSCLTSLKPSGLAMCRKRSPEDSPNAPCTSLACS